jgi:pimeloyl-ACP methyl ester carboxylesterase
VADATRADFVPHRIEVAGLRCRYFACGPADGPVVALIPSMLVIAPSYDTTARALAARGLRVYVVELPGSGRSAPLLRAWNSERYADWIAQWLDAVQLERATLIGHSNSGAAVLMTAARHPARVERLVLNDTVGFDRSRSLLRVLAMRALDAAIEWRLGLRKWHHVFYNLFVHPRNFLHQIWISATDDFSAVAPRVRTPTLLAWGRLDHTMPLRCLALAESLLGDAREYISPTGSHDWAVDHAPEFADAVQRFMAGDA